MEEAIGPPEPIGNVTIPSGTVLVMDRGALRVWCHDRPPCLPDNLLSSSDRTANADNGTDFRIDGPDARRAGLAYDRSCHPLYLYDVPADAIGDTEDRFAAFVAENGFDARLIRIDKRVHHRQRVDQLLENGVAAHGFSFHGIWAAACAGLPRDLRLTVYGRRRPDDAEFPNRWHDVYIDAKPGARTVRSEQCGEAMVDWAGLVFTDADALGAWVHDEPLDGKADFVFWGVDAEAAARAVGAPRLGSKDFGWLDLPVRAAAEKGSQVEDIKTEKGWRFATDFRPHSHHWQAMQQVRASGETTESGTVSVGGAELCLFMTSWGDGIYQVFADFDADGDLARVRVALGSERTVDRMRRVEERFFGEFAKLAFVSKRALEDGRCVRFLYCEAADREQDSGWRLMAGDETDEYNDKADNIALMPLRDLIDRDKALEDLFRQPVGSVFERRRCEDPFQPVTDWKPRTN